MRMILTAGLAGLVLAAVAACGGGAAQPAAPSPPSSNSASSSSADTITAEQAKEIATRNTGGGMVQSVERDEENDHVVWKVKIAAAEGGTRKVSVDRSTGEIVKIETDK